MSAVRLGVEGLGGEDGFLGKSHGKRRILRWSFELSCARAYFLYLHHLLNSQV